MTKNSHEWLKQANYDMDTAEIMFGAKRYIYAIFMCHLSIEKALKGLFTHRLHKTPPKIHNLIYLIEKVQLQFPENLYNSVFSLNRVSVPTRYPDDLQRMLKDYDEEKTREIIDKGKEVLQWLQKQL